MSLLPSKIDIPFRDISKLVINNSAFTNPYTAILSTAPIRITAFSAYITSASTVGNALYNSVIAANAISIGLAITNLTTTLGRFTSHTNNQSGISLSTGLSGSNFATISSIVSTVQQYKDDGSVCELVNKVFGAIMNASSIINQIAYLLGLLENLSTIPQQIADAINATILLLENQIISDLNAFADSQLEALQYAASAAINSLLHNPCISQILSQIGTQELKNIIKQKTSKILQ